MTGGKSPHRIGDDWERRVRDYLRSRGFDAERAYGAGRPDDVGDLIVGAWVPLLVECKAGRKSERGVWIREAREKVTTTRAGAIPVVVERRRGSPVETAFVTLDLDGFCSLIDAVARRVADLDEREIPDVPRGRDLLL